MTTARPSDRSWRRCGLSTQAIALALLGSCSVFIPSHSNSYKHEGESVEIEMVTAQGPDQTQFFAGRDAMAFVGPGLAAAAGAALVGLAVDQVGKAIDEEAEKLEAQHGQRVAVDNFWTTTPPQELWESRDRRQMWLQDYDADPAGAIVPKTATQVGYTASEVNLSAATPTDLKQKAVASATPQDFEKRKASGDLKLLGTFARLPRYTYSGFKYRRLLGGEAVFELECEFQRSTDGSVFLVVPKKIIVKKSKAKVLRLSYWPWHAWSWFADVGDEVEVDIRIAMDAIWIDEKQRPQMQTIGAFDLTKLRFDLTKPSAWQGTDRQARGWFPSVPRSHFAGGKEPSGTGAFWLEVQVTERDPSSGKNRIERAAKLVRDERDDLVEAVRDLGKNGP